MKWICIVALTFFIPFRAAIADQPQVQKIKSTKPQLLSATDMLKASPNGILKEPDPRRLLDASTPIEERHQIFSAYESLAEGGNVQAEYVVGSLYRIGQSLPASPVQRNDAKAALYLSNAATHGDILAMAKMAEMELAEGNYGEAMNWAQILGHYVKSIPNVRGPSQGYIAELVARIDEKFDNAKMKDVVEDLNTFIATYDTSIRTGLASRAEQKNNDPKEVSPTNSMYSPSTLNPKFAEQNPTAGFADYLIEFNPDGTVEKVWILDSVPNPSLGKTLFDVARATRINPENELKESEPRTAWLPIDFDDRRYRLNK
jgi:hypothetical protein